MADFNLPTDVYSWSGLPKTHREGLLSSIMPQLTKAATDYPNIISQYIEPQMRGFGDVTKQAGQGLLNQIVTRNISGTPASDATTDLMKALNEQRFGKLADMDLQAKMNYPSLLSQLAELGKATEQPFEPYQAMLNFMMSQA